MPNATAKIIGRKLRDVRHKRGMSLHDVEGQSGGRFKASAVGAYERGERVIPTDKLVELADFYGTRSHRLLPYPDDL